MDIFYEYMVMKEKKPIDYIIALTASLLSAVLTVLIYTFNGYLFGFDILLIAGVWFLMFRIVKARNVEYEYCLTNNEMDIDRIAGKRKRTHVITVDFKNIDICAAISDKEHYVTPPQKVLELIGYSDYEVYFADLYYNGEKTRVLFHMTDKMKENIKTINPMRVYISW